MSRAGRLYDEDGIDGPFEANMRAAIRDDAKAAALMSNQLPDQSAALKEWTLVGWMGNDYPASPREVLGLVSTSDEPSRSIYYFRFALLHIPTHRVVAGEQAHGEFVSRVARNEVAQAAVERGEWEPRLELAGKLLAHGGVQ